MIKPVQMCVCVCVCEREGLGKGLMVIFWTRPFCSFWITYMTVIYGS